TKGKTLQTCDGAQQAHKLPTAVSAGASLAVQFAPDIEHLALCIAPASLAEKLAALIGDAPGAPLRFDPAADTSGPNANSFRRLILHVVHEIDSANLEKSPVALTEFEQSLMVGYLCANPNNFSERLNGPSPSVAPWQVRAAEEYIAANWQQPITIEKLAQISNASARSIFYSFKERRGYSPMAFVKQVRLRHARELLRKSSGATSVTEAAYSCGFNNLGHFAKDYFLAFGERPSETLNVAKGIRPFVT